MLIIEERERGALPSFPYAFGRESRGFLQPQRKGDLIVYWIPACSPRLGEAGRQTGPPGNQRVYLMTGFPPNTLRE